MSVLQAQVIESLDGLSDDNLSFLLNMIDKFMRPKKALSESDRRVSNGICIGLFKGEKYVDESYDFDQDNEDCIIAV